MIDEEFLRKSVGVCNILGILFNTLKQQYIQNQGQDQMLFGCIFKNSTTKDPAFANFQKATFYCGLLLPFAGLEYAGNKKKQITAVQHILTESLKQSNEITKFVTANLSLLKDFDQIFHEFGGKNPQTDLPLPDDEQYKLAMALRSIGVHYGSVSMLHMSVQYAEKFPPKTNEEMSHKAINLEMLQEIIIKHEHFNKFIDQANLRNIHLLKPMVDGKTLQVLYECKAGKHIRFLIEECLKFQILNLNATLEEVE